jgi:hypothetical protein
MVDVFVEALHELAAIITPRAHAAAQKLIKVPPATASGSGVPQKYGELA